MVAYFKVKNQYLLSRSKGAMIQMEWYKLEFEWLKLELQWYKWQHIPKSPAWMIS